MSDKWDSKDGQTHYYGDGHPQHTKEMEPAQEAQDGFEQELKLAEAIFGSPATIGSLRAAHRQEVAEVLNEVEASMWKPGEMVPYANEGERKLLESLANKFVASIERIRRKHTSQAALNQENKDGK